MDQATGRTAIVTGAGKRVGQAITRALLDDGWSVLAHVHHDDDGVCDGAVRVVANLAHADCAATIMAWLEGLPPPRLLVNNAARFAWDGPGEFDVDEFDAHLHVNVRAPVLLAEEFAALAASGDRLIVNLLDSKVAAPNGDYLSYTLSKQALSGWTEIAARTYARRGVRVNAIAPGLMLQSPGQSAANFAAQHRRNPLGRGVEPADVVAALRYLIDAPVVTGQTILLDSGHRFMSLERDVQFGGEG